MMIDSIFNRIASHYGYGGGMTGQGGQPTDWRENATHEGLGFWGSLGRGLMSRFGGGSGANATGSTGIGVLPQFSGGVTPSAGGWPIDANGNLISSAGDLALGGNITTVNPIDQTPRTALTHTTALPAFAMENSSEIRKRNII